MRQHEFLRLYDLPLISKGWQRDITRPVICYNHTTRGDHLLGKSSQTIPRGICYMLKPDAPNPIRALVFNGDGHQCLARGSAPSLTWLAPTSHECLVHLNHTRKLIAPWPNHRSTQLVQPLPRGLVTSQIQDAIKPQSICPILLACDMLHSSQPHTKWFSSAMKNRPCCDRRLHAATPAVPQSSTCLPRVGPSAARARKSFRPSHLAEILKASLFSLESQFKLGLGSRVVFIVHGLPYYSLELLESTRYPRLQKSEILES